MRFAILALVGTAIALPVSIVTSGPRICSGKACLGMWKRHDFVAHSSLHATDGNEPLKRDIDAAEDVPQTLNSWENDDKISPEFWKREAEKYKYELWKKDDNTSPEMWKKDDKISPEMWKREANKNKYELWKKEADADAEPAVAQ